MVSLGYQKNKSFYHMMAAVMLPITIQNLIASSVNLVDNVMIGKLGELSITSVGLGNQIFFLLSLVLFGGCGGTSIFIAQYWGKKEIDPIKSLLSLSLWFGGIMSFLFFIPSFFMSEKVLRILTNDQETIALGAQYLRIVSVSFMLTAFTFALGSASRSIGRAKLPMVTSGISLILNVVFNWILIFGIGPFPALGVRGAALGTLLARTFEFAFIVWGIYKTSPELHLTLKNFFKVPAPLLSKVTLKSWPVILNETFWALGMTAYTMVYARIGNEAAAAVFIANTVNSLFMVFCFGLGNAASIMLGNILGENKIDLAIEYNKKFLALGVMGGILIGSVIFLITPNLIHFLYSLEQEAFQYTVMTLRFMSLYMPFRFYNTIVIIGTLRSGGDTIYSMLIEIGCVWGIGVPMAIFGGLVLGLPVYWVVAMVSLEEVTKVFLGIPRIRSNKWAKNLVH